MTPDEQSQKKKLHVTKSVYLYIKSFLPEYSSGNRDKCLADSARRKSYLCFLVGLFSQFVIAETEYLFILAMCFLIAWITTWEIHILNGTKFSYFHKSLLQKMKIHFYWFCKMCFFIRLPHERFKLEMEQLHTIQLLTRLLFIN